MQPSSRPSSAIDHWVASGEQQQTEQTPPLTQVGFDTSASTSSSSGHHSHEPSLEHALAPPSSNASGLALAVAAYQTSPRSFDFRNSTSQPSSLRTSYSSYGTSDDALESLRRSYSTTSDIRGTLEETRLGGGLGGVGSDHSSSEQWASNSGSFVSLASCFFLSCEPILKTWLLPLHPFVLRSILRAAGKASRVPSHHAMLKHRSNSTVALSLTLSNELTLSPFVVFVASLNPALPVTRRAVHLASPTVLLPLLHLEDHSSRLLTSAHPQSSKTSRLTDDMVNNLKSILTLSPICTKLRFTDTRSVAAVSIPVLHRRLQLNQSR